MADAPLTIGIAVILFWLVVTALATCGRPTTRWRWSRSRLQPPSWAHWLGTDALGRDVLTRTLHGARHSMPIAVLVVVVGGGRSAPCSGAISGFFGGLAGGAIMRLVDVTLSFPPMLLAMAVAASLGPGLRECGDRHGHRLVAGLCAADARPGARGQASASMSKRRSPAAPPAGGYSIKHILPLCWTPMLVNATMDFGQVVLLAASLSFIGLGATPPTPEWGSMISEGAIAVSIPGGSPSGRAWRS